MPGRGPEEEMLLRTSRKGIVWDSDSAYCGLYMQSLLRTQDSVPSLEEHVTVGRSRDSLTPNGSRDSLGKRSPDWSRDQVTLPVQTRSCEDAHRIHNAKIGKQPSLAKGKTWENSHGRSTDPTVVGDLRGASHCFIRSITNAS
jgi:hypothetical protein